MVHTRYTTLYKIAGVFLILVILLLNVTPTLGLTKEELTQYTGNYDYKADHDINNPGNVDAYNKKISPEEREENLKMCFQAFIGWGMTPQGAAGIVANIKNESGGDYKICWGYGNSATANYTWKEYTEGYDKDVGFGLIEFTASGLVFDLWDVCYELGVQWTDFGAQLEFLRRRYEQNTGIVWDEKGLDGKKYVPMLYDPSCTAYECGYSFCAGAERPGGNLETICSKRGNDAEGYYEKWKNLGGLDSTLMVGRGNSSQSSSLLTLSGLVSEWELVGMPAKSGLLANAVIPSLPNYYDLSTSDQYSIGGIRNRLEEESAFNAWNMVRQLVVFVGLLIAVYTVLLALAMVFDTVNIFFDLSLVRVLTLGRLNYKPYVEDVDMNTSKSGKVISKKRMVVVLIIMFAIAMLFISGGVFSGVLRVVYWFTGLF